MSLVHPFIEEGWRIGRTVGLCFFAEQLLSLQNNGIRKNI